MFILVFILGLDMVPEGDIESDEVEDGDEDKAPLGIVTKKSKKKNKQQINLDLYTIKKIPGSGVKIVKERETGTGTGTGTGTDTRTGTGANGRESPSPSPSPSDDENNDNNSSEDEDEDEDEENEVEYEDYAEEIIGMSIS